MHRTPVLAALAAVCAAAVVAQPASAARFSLTSVSATSAGSVGPGYCGITTAATYAGRPPGNARSLVGVQLGGATRFSTYQAPVPASGTAVTYQIQASEIFTGTSHLVFLIEQPPRGRQVAFVSLSPSFATTAGTCPPSGTSLGSWAAG